MKILHDFLEKDRRVLNYYLNAGPSFLDACGAYDAARSTEKMTQWENIGSNNSAWQNGPYVSEPANKKDTGICRDFPYIIRMSPEFQMATFIVAGHLKKGVNGGVKLPSSERNFNGSTVEPILAKLIIIEQFEIFRDFLLSFKGPYNKKHLKEWKTKLDEATYEDVERLIDRRNNLVHEIDAASASMKEAVEFFYSCIRLAPELSLLRDG